MFRVTKLGQNSAKTDFSKHDQNKKSLGKTPPKHFFKTHPKLGLPFLNSIVTSNCTVTQAFLLTLLLFIFCHPHRLSSLHFPDYPSHQLSTWPKQEKGWAGWSLWISSQSSVSRRSRCAKLPGSAKAQFTEFIDVEPIHHLQCVEHWCQMQGMRSMMSVHTAIELPCHWQHQLRVVSILAFSHFSALCWHSFHLWCQVNFHVYKGQLRQVS